MCADPATLFAGISKIGATVGTKLASAATALQVAGAGVSALYTMKNASAQAAAARQTAQAQEQAARDALEAGEDASDRKRREGAQFAARQKAALAANGVDVGGAAAIDILDDTAELVEQDAFAIRENSRLQAQSFSQQAANSKAQAESYDSQALFQPIATVLTTGAKVGEKYAEWAGA